MIEIAGHELPTKGLEGCPDFELRPWRSGLQIWFRCGSGFFQAWGALCSIEKYHAACVAHKHYLWLAQGYHASPQKISLEKYLEYITAAAAWGALADKLMTEG